MVPFDENKSGDPIDGLGDEIVPSRGMPFEEVEDDVNDDQILGDPRDVTPEELSGMFDNLTARRTRGVNLNWLETPSGMGANEPVLTDGDFTALDVPFSEAGGSTPSNESQETSQPVVGQTMSDEFASLVTQDRMVKVWQRIDQAQIDVREKVPNWPIARELISDLETARNQLVEGVEKYEEAERTLSEVELRIAVVERSRAENRFALGLFAYELIWAIGLVTFFIIFIGQDLTDMMILVQSAAWGALGGIAGAFYALWKHVSKDLDFSKQYALWYITNPITGFLLGIFVFLLTKFGLLSLFSGDTSLEITSPFAIYLLAFVIGYQQNVAWKLMRRVLKVFQLVDDDDG